MLRWRARQCRFARSRFTSYFADFTAGDICSPAAARSLRLRRRWVRTQRFLVCGQRSGRITSLDPDLGEAHYGQSTNQRRKRIGGVCTKRLAMSACTVAPTNGASPVSTPAFALLSSTVLLHERGPACVDYEAGE